MTTRKKNISIALVAVIAVITTAIVGGSFYMLDYALTPNATTAAKDAERDSFMFANYPYLRSWEDSLKRKSALKDTFIINKEGVRLHAIYLHAPKPTDRTAIAVHGYTDRASRMLMIGYLYNHELGYNVLMPDLQYHGLSGGDEIQMGWKDRLDVMQWINVANDIFGGNTKMVIHGISMGAATTMMVSGEELPNNVKCFVEDCGYTSVWDEFKYQFKEQFGMPPFPLLYTASALCRIKYGWNFKEASAIEQLKKCTKPMLFIHGGSDTYVPTKMVHELYAAKPGIKELWIPEGVEHAESYLDCREEYTRRVADFVGKYNN